MCIGLLFTHGLFQQKISKSEYRHSVRFVFVKQNDEERPKNKYK